VIIFQSAREIILSSKIYQYCLNDIYKTQSIKDDSCNSQNRCQSHSKYHHLQKHSFNPFVSIYFSVKDVSSTGGGLGRPKLSPGNVRFSIRIDFDAEVEVKIVYT
jgi:hypothetical protein